ncbi:DUF3098 domain-containing protein [Polluticaenibacter yanchengensis]|uniref:DUF3098 domain-containing protein n=1 Tax=Polluticaenibacter yanchengensis TaxID=3014562 RepID=A0ABT4UGR5_9BACT|nr:DUF3098 domain-containing protein [Chitinophagaceae bacterium LY-5]
MATVHSKSTAKNANSGIDQSPLFGKSNYLFMLIGAVIIAIGMLLMVGGKSADPNQFNYNEVYSKTRLTVAPILIVLGLIVEIYAIFKKSN